MTRIPRIFIMIQDKQLRDFMQAALVPEGVLLQFIALDIPIQDVLTQYLPDLIIIDTALPNGINRFKTITRLHQRQPVVLLLLLHQQTEDTWQTPLAQDGVEGFRIPGEKEELLQRIRALLQPDQHRPPLAALERNSAKKSMLRGFVHEISNTLTSNMLVLTTGFLEDETLCLQNLTYLHQVFELIEPLLPDDTREHVLEYLHHIDQNEESLDRILRMINNANDRAICRTKLVSEYAKLEYRPMQIEALHLGQELSAVLAQHQREFTTHDIAITVDGDVHTPFFGHKPHLHALFEHLIKNAYEALLAQPQPHVAPQLSIRLTETESALQCIFRDNANGILPEHLPEVFEPFYTTSPKTHSGLGLPFSAKLIMLHRGAIRLESSPGEGTSVYVTLPIHGAAFSQNNQEN
jgi:signal transduction histidine kinase